MKEKPDAPMPIGLPEVPGILRDVVQKVRTYTQEDWRKFTEVLPLVYKKTFLIARAVSQEERNKQARELIKQWGAEIEKTEELSDDPSPSRLLLPLCLSDKELDLAISTFHPQKMH